ncbi:MAG: hypothetical protein K2N79_00370 [Muribaculaceae bacterium]|nr:hypothetical protein [Muribaculaceae bacterium]MDE7154729.1 hypothetical protein [Muribaculaceae bacterium]
MEKTARIISAIFNPLLIPTYTVAIVMFATILCIVTPGTKFGVIGMTFLITAFIPALAIFVLYKLKIVSDSGLNERKERLIPYLISAACYVGAAFYFSSIHAPMWLIMFMVGAAVATVICSVVSLWWKISAHATSVSGMATFIFYLIYYQLNVFDLNWVLYAAIFAAGLTETTRLILSRHTEGQLLAGTVNGVVCISLAMTVGMHLVH